jgi:hypothetical protein
MHWPRFAPELLLNGLLTATLTVTGALLVAKFAPRLFLIQWDQQKLVYELFKQKQLERIAILRKLMLAYEEVALHGGIAIDRRVTLGRARDGMSLEPTIGAKLMSENSEHMAKMNSALARARELADEYGGLPKPYRDKAATLVSVVETTRASLFASVSNSAHTSGLDQIFNSDMSQMRSLLLCLEEAEQKLLVEERPRPGLKDEVFRPHARLMPHAHLLEPKNYP